MLFYDEKQAIKACLEEPSLIFDLIKDGYYHLVDYLITNNKIDMNLCDVVGNNVIMRLLKAKQYDLVIKFMRKRSFNPNHQNFDGNTLGHILAHDNSVSALRVVEVLTRNKNYMINIKNKKGETVLDRAIHSKCVYTAFKILEDKRFNSIDILSFNRLYKAYIKNAYYGKYSKLNHLEVIIDSLEKKELLPGMRILLNNIEENLDTIRSEIMNNKLNVLENVINSSLIHIKGE